MINAGGIRLIVLDVGGVLRDSALAISRSYEGSFKLHSLPYSFDPGDVWRMRGFAKYNHSKNCVKALIALSRAHADLHVILLGKDVVARLDSLVKEYIKAGDESLIERLDAEYHRLFKLPETKKLVALIEGTDKAMDNLVQSGYKLAVFSNASRETIIRDLPRTEMFAVILGDEEVSKKKPSGEGIVKICGILGIPVKNTVYVGDAGSDIIASRDAGCFAIAVLSGMGNRRQLESERPDMIFSNLLEMSEYFKKKKGA